MEQGAEDGIGFGHHWVGNSRVLDEVWAIEQACFSAPWTRKMLAAELSGKPICHFLIAKCSDLQSAPASSPGTSATGLYSRNSG